MKSRLLAAVVQIVAVSLITFYLFSVVPGDFYSGEQLNPQISEKSIAEWRNARGLTGTWLTRYVRWAASCLRGQFGVSLAYGMPIGPLIAPRIAKSSALLFPSWLLGWFLGLSLAFWAARSGNRILEPAMSVANVAPEVIVVSLLIWTGVIVRAPLRGVWLPVLALLSVVVPLVFLHAVRGLSAARQENFVILAESRKIPAYRLWTRFILPAASHPLLSLIGPSLAAAAGSSLVIEAATGWPGLGSFFIESVQARDYEVVQAVVLLLAILLTITNFIADLFLYRIDSRIRLKNGRSN